MTTNDVTVFNERESVFVKDSKVLQVRFFVQGICYTVKEKSGVSLHYNKFDCTNYRSFRNIKSYGVYNNQLKFIRAEKRILNRSEILVKYLYCYDEEFNLLEQRELGGDKHLLCRTGEIRIIGKTIEITAGFQYYHVIPRHPYSYIQSIDSTLSLTENNLYHYYQPNKHFTDTRQAFAVIDDQLIYKTVTGFEINDIQFNIDDIDVIKYNGSLFCVTKMEIYKIIGTQLVLYYQSQYPITSVIFDYHIV